MKSYLEEQKCLKFITFNRINLHVRKIKVRQATGSQS